MKTSPNGRKFIAKEEGNILYAYDDANEKRVNVGDTSRGTLTIGVGHTSAAGSPAVVPGMTITAAQSDSILANDLSKVENQVTNLVKVPLNQNQFDALVSFQFNTGGLSQSQILRKLNAGDTEGAANAFMNWTKANGNPTLLTGRRTREKALFLTKPTSSAPAIGTAGGVVAAGGAAALQAPVDWVPYIVAGTLLLALVGFLVMDALNYNKTRTTVKNVTNTK